MKQHTLDLIFSDSLFKTTIDNEKSFCKLDSATFKELKEIHTALSLHFKRLVPKCTYTQPKTFFVETSTHLNLGVSFEVFHEHEDENVIKNLVKRFIDLIANAKINLEKYQSFDHMEVIKYLRINSGNHIQQPVNVYVDSDQIGTIAGMYSEVIFLDNSIEEYSINARIADLDHDKRRIRAIGNKSRYEIAFDVEKNFKSLCEHFAEQSLLTLYVIKEYDAKGKPKITLKSFDKIKA